MKLTARGVTNLVGRARTALVVIDAELPVEWQARLGPNARLVDLLERRVNDDTNLYLPSSGGEGRGSRCDGGGANNGPVPRIVGEGLPSDEVARRAGFLMQNLHELASLAERVEAGVLFLLPIDSGEARKIADGRDNTTGAICANPHCQRFVACTRADPLRGGRCDACRKYRERHEGRERPAELCKEDAA